MPTISELATELGLDVSTFKPEATKKWNDYLSGAETQYASAAQLKKDAEENLRKVQLEQDEINKYVAQYGQNEQTVAALTANLEAHKAALKTLKDQGYAVELPNMPNVNVPTPKKPDAFDPEQFRGQVGNVMAQAFNANNKYQALFGKPIPEDMETLASEAQQNRKPLMQYVAEKYDFAGEEKRRGEVAEKAKIDAAVAAGVKKYQDEHPVTEGNPFQSRGIDSKFSQVFKPREGADLQKFGNLPARDKVAQSVARVKAVLANQE